MIWQISLAVIAIAFVVLVVFLVKTLRSVTDLVAQTNQTIQQVQQQVTVVSQEANELLRHTNEVSLDVRNKLHALDKTFYTIKNVGDVVSEITTSVRQTSATVTNTMRNKVEKELNSPKSIVNRIAPLVPVAVDMWKRLKQSRTTNSKSVAVK
ncbi:MULTISPECIES: DUF948 domain-containing protein [Paenibacillus]|uniref:DUF948 domain-containing protein n=1 Tax=Paenibacillus TaxID=44249 RepID=UPI00020D66F5|nr:MULTISPECIES: DUF948 domain-containing protein [Paenibacillus]EGL15955.1 hypothetical protein HMPREF9413_0116 [Paenibacillus sp. HGF7]EPD80851.1 hypothetical protein HMPREF1207_04608 [Paenibacillus sp. HGH0039]MBV6714717.1 DUF948 domain-containing protein [Paenibacillus chitinolyticus]MEC0246960.1 DUF948 domain-containing protein [Paenibacillus chitinolyticus]SEG10285.1 Uncharacterized protein YoxC, contains an MCP-like domain [Paenibacillus sp. UNC499MF]